MPSNKKFKNILNPYLSEPDDIIDESENAPSQEREHYESNKQPIDNSAVPKRFKSGREQSSGSTELLQGPQHNKAGTVPLSHGHRGGPSQAAASEHDQEIAHIRTRGREAARRHRQKRKEEFEAMSAEVVHLREENTFLKEIIEKNLPSVWKGLEDGKFNHLTEKKR